MTGHRVTASMLVLVLCACTTTDAAPVRYPDVRLAPNCQIVGHVRWSADVDETLCLDEDLQREVVRRALARGGPWR